MWAVFFGQDLNNLDWTDSHLTGLIACLPAIPHIKEAIPHIPKITAHSTSYRTFNTLYRTINKLYRTFNKPVHTHSTSYCPSKKLQHIQEVTANSKSYRIFNKLPHIRQDGPGQGRAGQGKARQSCTTRRSDASRRHEDRGNEAGTAASLSSSALG